MLIYKPWRNYIEQKRRSRRALLGDEVRIEVDVGNGPRARDHEFASDQHKGPKLLKTPDNNSVQGRGLD